MLALMGVLGASFAAIVIAIAGPVVWDSAGRAAAVMGGGIRASSSVAFWD